MPSSVLTREHRNQRVGFFRYEKLSLIARRSMIYSFTLRGDIGKTIGLAAALILPAPSLYNMLTATVRLTLRPNIFPLVSHKVWWDGVGANGRMAKPPRRSAT
jgi:hypothetical protein